MATSRLSIGSYIAAISGVLLVLAEIFAVEGALLSAVFDLGNMPATGWVILSAVTLLPLLWLGIPLTRHAIEAERDLLTSLTKNEL